jgi:hypothetical protein
VVAQDRRSCRSCHRTFAGCRSTRPSRAIGASKGGSESTVKIAKADLVPNDSNLRSAHDSFADLEATCEAFCADVNARVHRVTRRAPDQMLTEERALEADGAYCSRGYDERTLDQTCSRASTRTSRGYAKAVPAVAATRTQLGSPLRRLHNLS